MVISLWFVITNMLTCFWIKSDTQNRWQTGPIMIKFVFSRRFIILCFLSAKMKLPIMEAVWRRSFSVIAFGGWISSRVLIVRQTGRILLFFIFGVFNRIFPFHSASHWITIMKNTYQKAHLKFGPFFFSNSAVYRDGLKDGQCTDRFSNNCVSQRIDGTIFDDTSQCIIQVYRLLPSI